MESEEKFDFYYVAYQCMGFAGCIIIPQHKPETGGPNPDGMNIAAASAFITSLYNSPAIILFWKRTTRRRTEEFTSWVDHVTGRKKSKKPRHLHLVKEPPK